MDAHLIIVCNKKCITFIIVEVCMNLSKHYFPGGNTCKGFVNYFDGIIAPWVENMRIYVLKGGPGVGKNTFMKAFGDKAMDKGFEVEYFHCASDVKSLDAVHIPKLGVTMLDGTAPHVVDPVTPGAVDGIINLGIHLDEKGLETKRAKILELMKENSRGYKRTFSYLAAAGKLEESTNYFYLCSLDRDELRSEVQDLFGTHDLKLGKYNGETRKLFASAITPQGQIDYFSTVVTKEKIISLHGPKVIAAEYIKMALHFAAFMGYGCEVFYDPILPENPVHLIIRDLNLCITTASAFPKQIEKVVDLSQLCDQNVVNKYESTFAFNELYSKQLVEASVESLLQTKGIHDDIEVIYKEYMDFSKVTEFSRKFIEEFFG